MRGEKVERVEVDKARRRATLAVKQTVTRCWVFSTDEKRTRTQARTHRQTTAGQPRRSGVCVCVCVCGRV